MAGDSLKHYVPGQQFVPVGAYNAFIDTARAFKAGGGQQPSPGFGTRDMHGGRYVLCKAGGDIDRFKVQQLSAPIFTDVASNSFKNDLVFSLSAPTGPLRPNIVVTQEPIAAGKFGWCAVAGITLVKVDIISPMGSADYCMPWSGQQLLRLADRGFPVLWKESTSSGEKFAAINLEWHNFPIIGKLANTLARGGTSASFAVHRPTGSGSIGAATGETLPLLEDIGQIAAAASPLPINTVCTVEQVNGSYILISYDCDA